jgi:hypothetical protein
MIYARVVPDEAGPLIVDLGYVNRWHFRSGSEWQLVGLLLRTMQMGAKGPTTTCPADPTSLPEPAMVRHDTLWQEVLDCPSLIKGTFSRKHSTEGLAGMVTWPPLT